MEFPRSIEKVYSLSTINLGVDIDSMVVVDGSTGAAMACYGSRSCL